MPERFRHDELFKKALDYIEAAKELFKKNLPEKMKNFVDWDTLARSKIEFIDKDLKKSAADVIFEAKIKGREGYLIINLEHESEENRFVALKLLRYQVNIWEDYLLRNKDAKALPIIYSVIFSNSQNGYNSPRNIWDLSEDPEIAKDIWFNDYQLMDVNEAEIDFVNYKWVGVLELFMKNIRSKSMYPVWEEALSNLPELKSSKRLLEFLKLFFRYSSAKIEKEEKAKVVNLLSLKLSKLEMEDIMGSIAEEWLNEGMQQGIQKGKQEGITLGLQQGIEKGKMEEAISIAKEMLLSSEPMEKIVKYTGLSKEKIDSIKHNLFN
jgi:predicted transposase/invertase (TIGR01784 family)